MPLTYRSYKNNTYTLEDTPIHSGGEGSIHKVLTPKKGLVAKIYLTPQKAREFHKKILFMVNYPPLSNAPEIYKNSIIWPLDLLFSNGNFIGYVMPMVEQSVKLFTVLQSSLPKKITGTLWEKFDKSKPNAWYSRLAICYNLAKAVDLLHKSGKYVLIDMKPENILIKPNGHISLIDIDSIQISHNNRLLFSATAYTPEYAPPEFHKGLIKIKRDIFSSHYDHFSLAIIFYQLLIMIHPFMASHKKYTEWKDMIRNGFFVHGRRKTELHKIPPPHGRFARVPNNLRQLFFRALDSGSFNPALRPRPSEWAAAFLKEINAIRNTHRHNNNSHKNFSDQKKSSIGTKSGYKTSGPERANNPNGNNRVINTNPRKAKQNQQPPITGHATKCYNQTKTAVNNTHNIATPPSGSIKKKVQSPAQSTSCSNQASKSAGKSIVRHIFELIIILFLLFIVIPRLQNIVQEQELTNNSECIYNHICGDYFGFMEHSDGHKQLVYLRISLRNEDSTKLFLQIIKNAREDPINEQAKIDTGNRTIISEFLGEGKIFLKNTGEVILISERNNYLNWHFEK